MSDTPRTNKAMDCTLAAERDSLRQQLAEAKEKFLAIDNALYGPSIRPSNYEPDRPFTIRKIIELTTKERVRLEQHLLESAAQHEACRKALKEAEDVLTEFGGHSDETRTGWALKSIGSALSFTPSAPLEAHVAERTKELQADKERLDWLEIYATELLYALWQARNKEGFDFRSKITLRSAIDAARK